MTPDQATWELIAACLDKLRQGDVCAPYELANLFMAYGHTNDVTLRKAVVEALAQLAKNGGCNEAAIFLQEDWPTLSMALDRRWSVE
jgi:hypothetical protein